MSGVNRSLVCDARRTCRAQGPVHRSVPVAVVALCEAGAQAAVRRRPGRDPRVQRRAGDPPRPEVDRRRPGGGPRPRRGLARRAVSPAAGHRRGRVVRGAAVDGGAPAGRGRGGDAGRSVPASATAAGGVPRPLGIGAAALARDHGPDAAASVPGFPADLPAGQRCDDPDRRRHFADAAVDAGAGAARSGGAADSHLPALRDEVLDGGTPGPGPGRRSDDGRRGERARHPHHQGLRPAPQPGPRLPFPLGAAAHHGAGQGPPAGGHLVRQHPAPGAGHRCGAGARHGPGRERRPLGGHPGRLSLHGARAALAGGVDRLPAGDEPGVGDGDRAVLRGDGRGRGDGRLRRGRTGRGGRLGPGERPGPRRNGLRGRGVPLPRRGTRLRARAVPDRSADPARRDDGPGGGHGLRQDDAHRPGAAAARGHRGTDHAGRYGHRHHAPGATARAGVGGVRGADALLGERRGERADGRRRRRGRRIAQGAGHRPGRLRARSARGCRHPGRRAGPQPLRRPAATARAGPRRGRPAALPGPGRSALRAGRAHGGAGGGGAAAGPRPDHGDRGRAPAVHGDARGPGGTALRGPDRRRRHAPGTAARQRRVRLADVGRRRRTGRTREGRRGAFPDRSAEDLAEKGTR